MCNLYAMTTGRQAVIDLLKITKIAPEIGNFAPMSSIFPDYQAPIVRQAEHGRELTLARWGMPKPAFALKGKSYDSGVTNVRNTESAHWRRWLGIGTRCLVPFTSFSENETLLDGTHPPVWFALNEERPLAFFAGIWTNWTGTRKVKEGQIKTDLFAFLTTEPNKEVGKIHPKAMPVILTTPNECETWLKAEWKEAQLLQRPLADSSLSIVARGERKDPAV